MIGNALLGMLIGAAFGVVIGYLNKCSSGACPLTVNPYRGALWGAVLGTLLAFTFPFVLNKKLPESYRLPVEPPSANGVSDDLLVHIGREAAFEARVLEATGICLVDLFSDRCPPCHALAPIVSSLARKYAGKVTVCKVDLEQVPSLIGRYRVKAIPTVLIIKEGIVLKHLVGLRRESEYSALLDKLCNEEQ